MNKKRILSITFLFFALTFLASGASASPLCWECAYNDLCIPVAAGFGFDSCEEVNKWVCIYNPQLGATQCFNFSYCRTGGTCDFEY